MEWSVCVCVDAKLGAIRSCLELVCSLTQQSGSGVMADKDFVTN